LAVALSFCRLLGLGFPKQAFAYGYRGLKIFTSLKLRFQDFQRKRIIYLDFDGHTITGTAWNKDNMDPINAAPYDRDNNPGFSNAELTNIQEIWQKVSEDYAPFDVDVTTELQSEEQIRRTDSNDEYYGTRALVTRSNFGICDHCGGIAYVGSYNDTGEMHDYYMPALVFFDRLDNGNPKSVAEAISHEVGHNLKLFHDGTSDRGYYAALLFKRS
jgi:hypothetical protein